MSRSFLAPVVAVLVAVSLVAAGCSSTPAREDRPTITPASPAVAPEPAVPAAGQVIPAAAGQGLAFDPVSRRLAAITDGAVVLYSVDGGLRETGRFATEGRANQVVPYGDGFLVAAKTSVMEISGDQIQRNEKVDGEVLSVAPYTVQDDDHGWALAGTAQGDIVLLRTSAAQKKITGPVEASQVLVRGGKVAVVDRRQASITEVDVPGGKTGKSLRVGRGITNAVIDPFGRMLAVDTGENQVFSYTIDPFMLRFQYPVPSAPWAVTYDEAAKLMWVTQTATNEVAGYALGSGMPDPKLRFPTVRQPNAVAVDATTGTLYVQSATGAGIQAIPTR
ncbi:Streptogramin lyase OS=Tsukamurella paurometabola (strain ATCC 8368 / DSM / CCUG 35730 / CIP 100753 / JCM 10117 / KCTC 9821 / NBRC 16120 / NCIMB 702349/ NCTC 13040) OX=521096 GN=Tpau_2132 PE=4 SV=1 [Tsukamurella paurometabola]|uniref:Streptogramin lyase n=1 Tax=Tsukamurella paurometabola (strain ATCC 8368 / DSM 20162 / CCUG 35730 / CIP 100753 / JCM 10117 / KCTC 9821 / NBRC 16120 / NCIMB 702349 / NCTC 13040) TaxID=521096 RepID=D5UPI7_TSUPD|nr:hypothetical protein [Tsukamurella paurometabola]ADG78743.1 conserved hypothetical protein [Tsukamurella paurometabola DSM 20162]SUP32983.1 Streptogramin lyase [Tsukamurella paurometabola]